MKIIELLEGRNFKDLDFVKPVGDEGRRELNYNLSEDLMFFMNNNDDAYRKHLYPAIVNCIKHHDSNKDFNSKIFTKAVNECYNMYIKEYPIRELPQSLDDKLIKEVCEKIHEEVCQHITDGKYK